jgi:glutathione S-transferase
VQSMSSPRSMTIIGRPSSINVRKVLWTCCEIGLAYTFDGDWEADVRVARRPELLELNPNDQFPVLLDRDGQIWESNTICRYLAAEHRRTDLLPANPRERAVVEQWMDWQATDLNSAWRYAFMALVRRAPQYDRQSDVDASVAAWNAAMTILEQRLAAARDYVTGPVFTLADVVLGVSVNRWIFTPMPKPDLPAVMAYYERLSDRPGFVRYVRTGVP